MQNKTDVRYVCATLGNLCGIPVGLYRGKEQVLYYAVASLPMDPFAPFLDEIRSVSGHVGYFVTAHGFYYGVVTFGESRIVVGPSRQIPLKEQELREIAFERNVPHADADDFVKGMKSIVQIPLAGILQMLCMVNHILNDGETLTLSDVSILDTEQDALVERLETEQAERTIRNADNPVDTVYPHTSMNVEAFMLDAVRKGNVAELKKFFSSVPAVRSGIIAEDELRQAKNILIVTATLVSRSAIYGGLDAEEALTLSDEYIQKCELMNDVRSITNLTYRLAIDYAERVEKLRCGKDPSKMVIEVSNYVRRHLSEPVSVEKLAKHVCKGRSRLSTDFKKETGENLSAFILRQKIEESKRLLRYTDKAAVEIALYLGFSSQSHFSRTFKQYVGTTPNDYRRAKTRP